MIVIKSIDCGCDPLIAGDRNGGLVTAVSVERGKCPNSVWLIWISKIRQNNSVSIISSVFIHNFNMTSSQYLIFSIFSMFGLFSLLLSVLMAATHVNMAWIVLFCYIGIIDIE